MFISYLTDVKNELLSYYDGWVTLTPKLITSVIVLLIFLSFSKFVSIVIRRFLNKAEDVLLLIFLVRLIQVIIMIIGCIIILNIIGLKAAASQILAGAGVTAFIVGFAFKDIGENFLAGMLLAFKRPFKIGDFIETTGHGGKVVGMNLREIHLKTYDGRDIYIPTSSVIKTPLINYTVDGYQRLTIHLDFSKNVNISDVEEKLFERLGEVPSVIKTPNPPTIEIKDISGDKYKAALHFWVNTHNPDISNPMLRSYVMSKIATILNDLKKEDSSTS